MPPLHQSKNCTRKIVYKNHQVRHYLYEVTREPAVLYFSILRVRVRVWPSLVPRLPQEPGNEARVGQAIL